jgi:hypothetical protein
MPDIVNDPSQGNMTSNSTDWRSGLDLSDLDADLSAKPKSNGGNDWRKDLNIDGLNKEFLGVDSSKAAKSSNGAYTGANLGPLQGKPVSDDLAPSDKSNFDYLNTDLVKGGIQGLKDIPNTGASLIGWVDSKLSDAGAKRYSDFNNRLSDENSKLPVDNTAFNVGRMGGQALATAPLMPVAAMGAAGDLASAVPYAGRVLAPAVKGALGGATFGAATNSSNDAGLVSNVLSNAGAGAVAGPVVEAGMGAANKVISGATSAINTARISRSLRDTGIDPKAAKNMAERLAENGHTPDTAMAQLSSMGPNATLADLTPGLADEAGGLAAMTGKQSNLLKSRYQDRAAASNDTAHNIMETKLGPKPDLEAERDSIVNNARAATKTDYDAAHASNQALDVKPIADKIDNDLINAVGSEKSELEKVKGYLYDANGNIKVDIPALHKVRQAIDDRLSQLPAEGTSQKSATYRSLSNVRDEVDGLLKSNPEMASADAKFAQHMDTKNGLDVGYKSISEKPNYDKFEREFINASPEKQDAIRKGLRAQIGDMMERASRGELAGAQQMFAKKAANRKIMQLAFGNKGDEVLNALEKEATMRSTERNVISRSHTASGQAVRDRYAGADEEVRLRDIAMAGASDIAMGSPGILTGAMTARKGISHFVGKLGEASRERLKEGTGDLLSRTTQHGRDDALRLLNTVSKIQSGNNFKLPVDTRNILTNSTIPAVKETKNKLDKFRGISEQ